MKRALRNLDRALLGDRLTRFYLWHLKPRLKGIPRLVDGRDFPDPRKSTNPYGWVAYGGELSAERLAQAYRKGIFPYNRQHEPLQWWSPDPRCVIRPPALHVSRRLRSYLTKSRFTVTFDRAFPSVIDACRRLRQQDTWISPEILDAYTELHREGLAHSVEAWIDDRHVGGLYGVSMGGCFSGESMYSLVDHASKAALIAMVRTLDEHGFLMLDCQFPQPHLLQLGATTISRDHYLNLLDEAIGDGDADAAWSQLSGRTISVTECLGIR